MVFTYVGKGTVVLGPKNKPVEQLQPNDRIIGFYIGVGTKMHSDSIVKSVRYVGKAKCKYFGSLSEYVLVPEGQQTIDPTFKYTNIGDTIYNVSRNIPRPIKVYRTLDDVDIYEIELKDSDIVPLLTSYMFVTFTDKQYIGDSGVKENKEKQSKQKEGNHAEIKQETNKTRRKSTKRKSNRSKTPRK